MRQVNINSLKIGVLVLLGLLVFSLLFLLAFSPDPSFVSAQRPTPTDCPGGVCPTYTPVVLQTATVTVPPYPCPYPPCTAQEETIFYSYFPFLAK